MTRVEPFGTWASPIGADLVSVASIGLSPTGLDGGAVSGLSFSAQVLGFPRDDVPLLELANA